MKNRLAVCFLALGLSPAWADQCPYVSGFDFGRVTFTEDASKASFDFNGDIVGCSLEYGDENGNWLTCDDGSEGAFSFAASSIGADDDAFFVYRDSLWYRDCAN